MKTITIPQTQSLISKYLNKSLNELAGHFSRKMVPYFSFGEWDRLSKLPRYTPGETSILGSKIEFTDALSFCVAYKEIFKQQIYRFRTTTPIPNIIDCGSNIGLSIIYFKKLYPSSKILAFEADPSIAKTCQRNIDFHNCKNVQLIPKAVWIENGTVSFVPDNADGGRINDTSCTSQEQSILSVRLKDYLDSTIDLLKMDIEGAENEVLLDCKDQLQNVKLLFFEYHGLSGKPQKLHSILELISKAGFDYYIYHHALYSPSPFHYRPTMNGLSSLLNIFAINRNHLQMDSPRLNS